MWIGLLCSLMIWFDPQAAACKGNPNLAGSCFVVRGRLRAYNGNPTFRIWPAGTSRLLGVTGAHPGEEPILPANLGASFDRDIFGAFEVCPFTPRGRGVMQRVCIESVKVRTVVERHKPQ